MVNASGIGYIYMAIRRPHKPPEAATDVFAIDTFGGTSPSPPTWSSGFPVDWAFFKYSDQSNEWAAGARLIQGKKLVLNTNAAESSDTGHVFDYMNGWYGSGGTLPTLYSWMFKRAPGFFDVVAYTGTGASQAVNHNLEVTPEFVIIKNRAGGTYTDWICWHKDLTSTNPYIFLNSNAAEATYGAQWIAPSSTGLNLGAPTSYINVSTATYIAYLFATLPGISKVGSYTGNGGAQTIDCGFTNGARFVLIKQTDGVNNWRVFDTLRGIGAGNDPVLSLSNTAAQDTNKNWLEADNSGFRLNTSDDNVNANTKSYIFLAIA